MKFTIAAEKYLNETEGVSIAYGQFGYAVAMLVGLLKRETDAAQRAAFERCKNEAVGAKIKREGNPFYHGEREEAWDNACDEVADRLDSLEPR